MKEAESYKFNTMDRRENYWITVLLFITLGVATGCLKLWIMLTVVAIGGCEVRRYVKNRLK